jgi:hypothetical protein
MSTTDTSAPRAFAKIAAANPVTLTPTTATKYRDTSLFLWKCPSTPQDRDNISSHAYQRPQEVGR